MNAQLPIQNISPDIAPGNFQGFNGVHIDQNRAEPATLYPQNPTGLSEINYSLDFDLSNNNKSHLDLQKNQHHLNQSRQQAALHCVQKPIKVSEANFSKLEF